MSNAETNASRGMRRREFLRGSALGVAGLALATGSAPAGVPATNKQVRNLIFLVSDGMSPGVLTMAEEFSKQVRGRGTHWVALQKREDCSNGLMEAYSRNSLVPDSAAASSVWGCGQRVDNRALNTLPDGSKLVPIGKLVKDAGRSLGLVTTATVTHATPAGFAASAADRDDEDAIAMQYLGLVDVALGGGSVFFDRESREDGQDLAGTFAKAGYQVLRSKDDLLSSSSDKLLGLFAPEFLPYMIDYAHSKADQKFIPTLEEMSRVALDRLNRNSDGFLLQIEGARVDHAAHINDIATLLWEQLAFDDALGLSLDFAAKHPDTLVIVTSDHGNANPGINGMGPGYASSSQAFAKVALARESFFAFYTWAKNHSGELAGNDIATRFLESFGVSPSQAETEAILQLVAGKKVGDWNAQLDNFPGVMGQILGNHNGVGWTGTTHTSDPMIFNATGPGADLFSGYFRNDQVFGHMCKLLNLEPAPVLA